MIDLNKIFPIGTPDNFMRRKRYSLDYDQYHICLWVGIDTDDTVLSYPENMYLSLSDYECFTIEIMLNGDRMNKNEMNSLFGFDFVKFSRNHNYGGFGWRVPKAFLIKILQKLGVASNMPDDAGDGE